MTLITYSRPRRTVSGRLFSDLMDDFFNEAVANQSTSTFTPSINISETEKEFSVEVEIPGMKKEDINISVENRTLTISGERKQDKQDENRRFHRVETNFGSFNRTLQLPEHVDEENIEAVYENGLLLINMGKREEKIKKQIAIK